VGELAPVRVVKNVAADDRAGLPPKGIETPPVGKHAHGVVHVVVFDDRTALARLRLVPAKPGRNAGIGHGVYDIVGDAGFGAKGVEDAHAAMVDCAAGLNLVGDDLVADGRIFRVGPVGREVVVFGVAGARQFSLAAPARHDAVAANVGQSASGDAIVAALESEPDTRRAEIRDTAALECAVFRVREFYTHGRHIGASLRACSVMSGLDAKVAERRKGPFGVREGQSLEPHVGDPLAGLPLNEKQLFELRRDECLCVGVFALGGLIGQHAGSAVEIPFAGLIDKFENVLDNGGLVRTRRRGASVADPAHRVGEFQDLALRRHDGRPRYGPVLVHHKFSVFPGKVVHGRGGREGDFGHIGGYRADAKEAGRVWEPPARQALSVGEQLAERPHLAHGLSHVEGPFAAVAPFPAGKTASAGNNRHLAGIGRVDHGEIGRARIRGPEDQGFLEHVFAFANEHRHVILEPLRDQVTHGGLGALDSRERFLE